MKTIYFHIGQTKTATTTLQTFFHDNRQWLADHGVFYPVVPEEHPLKIQHRFLVDSLHANGANFSGCLKDWRFLLDQISATALTKILISEEVFWHLFEQRRDLRQQAIQWIKEQFSGYDVKIICYLRRQDKWVESWYNQIVKTDVTEASRMTLAEFSNRINEYGLLDYHAVLSEWANVFGQGNIVVRPFELNQLIGKDILLDFCALIDINNIGGTTKPTDKQVSLSNAACEFSMIFNRASRAQQFKRHMLQILREFDSHRTKDSRRLMPATLATELLAPYAESNKLTATRFMKNSNDLFTDKSGHSEDYNGLSTQELADIIVHLYIEQQSQIRQLKKRISDLESRSQNADVSNK